MAQNTTNNSVIHAQLPSHGDPDLPPFKHRHESSTVELFYDLFFVANLATFTANHEIVDADSLKNYIGFFTILWFTWLQTSLFDVRFATDSIFNRFCKAISFGVMTGFAICGAIYDTQNVGENVKAFRALSIILMVSRLALVLQYGVVLWYVHKWSKTILPMLCTMISLLISAIIFLGTFWGYNLSNTGNSFPNQENGPQTYIAYYIVVCLEAGAVIAISCFWRVVSFKHTHLVERVGLLTLIIMGEGIIGMTKSVSQILQNSTSTSSNDIGVIIAAVLLIYFIWVLYFDQIEHDRFGTIRQQIWAMLHFPLHVCLILTVEGSTTLILWNIIIHSYLNWENLYPVVEYADYSRDFTSAEAVLNYLNESITEFSREFKAGALAKAVNYTEDLTKIRDLKPSFGSTEWNDQAGEIVDEIWLGVDNFIFENFGIEVPGQDQKAHTGNEAAQQDALFNVFSTVFYYFYIAAGLFLVILAVMYWFGKRNKTKGEWASMGVRLIAGAGIW
ncbi:MAG: low temperature requirement protein A [Nitrososphaerales archaeon]